MGKKTRIVVVFFMILALSANSLWAEIITIGLTAEILDVDLFPIFFRG